MMLCESTEEACGGGDLHVGPGAKSEGSAKGSGEWRSLEPNAGKAERYMMPDGSCRDDRPPPKVVGGIEDGRNSKDATGIMNE